MREHVSVKPFLWFACARRLRWQWRCFVFVTVATRKFIPSFPIVYCDLHSLFKYLMWSNYHIIFLLKAYIRVAHIRRLQFNQLSACGQLKSWNFKCVSIVSIFLWVFFGVLVLDRFSNRKTKCMNMQTEYYQGAIEQPENIWNEKKGTHRRRPHSPANRPLKIHQKQCLPIINQVYIFCGLA